MDVKNDEELEGDRKNEKPNTQENAKAKIYQPVSETEDVASIAAITKGLSSNKHLKWILAAVVLVIVVAIGILLLNQGQTDIGDGYEITNQKLVEEGLTGHINGTVKNTSGRTETLLMSWTLFDSHNNEVGTAVAMAENLPNQESEDFEAVFVVDNKKTTEGNVVKSFKLENVFFMKAENARLDSELNALKSRR